MSKDLSSQYTSIYSYASAYPAGWLRSSAPTGISLATVSRSVRGIDEDRPRSFLENYILKPKDDGLGASNGGRITRLSCVALETAQPALHDISPSGDRSIFLYNTWNKDDKKPYLEVLCENNDCEESAEESFRLDLSKVHGKIIGDSWFGGCSWSTDENIFAYVAQTKFDQKKSYFEEQSLPATSSGLDKDATLGADTAGKESDCATSYDWVEDWGEKYTGIADLSIFLLNIKTKEVTRVPGIDSSTWTVGQPCIAPSIDANSMVLAYTAWQNEPKKLGMIYCYQRRSKIMLCDISSLLSTTKPSSAPLPASAATAAAGASISDGNATTDADLHIVISKDIDIARSPRFSQNGKLLTFFGCRNGFKSHNGCSELFTVDAASTTTSTQLEEQPQSTGREIRDAFGDAPIRTLVAQVFDPKTNPKSPQVAEILVSHGDGSSRILEAAVTEPKNATFLGQSIPFPGLFTDQLPRHCFTCEDTEIVMTSMWGSCSVTLLVNVQTGNIKVISFGDAKSCSSCGGESVDLGGKVFLESSVVLDVEGERILCTRSSPCFPTTLQVIDLKSKTVLSTKSPVRQTPKILTPRLRPRSAPTKAGVALPEQQAGETAALRSSSSLLAPPAEVEVDDVSDLSGLDLLRTLSWKVFRHETDGIPFESILIYPSGAAAEAVKSSSSAANSESFSAGIPLIVVPHGGPHSCMPTSFVASYAFLALSTRSAVLHVNYRGSTGFGQRSIESLLGTIGENDVQDVHTATMHALSSLSITTTASPSAVDLSGTGVKLDGRKVGIVGGSHGGFLSGHMIGQHPQLYKVSCMRNPVFNIPSMVSVTDIPDWCYVEALGNDGYDFSENPLPSETDLLRMRRCSPVAHAHKIKAPTLVCLGMKDRRVPASQGLELHRYLKSRKIPTRLMVFPEDVHAIDQPASEANHWVAIALWINEYIHT